MKNIKVKFMKRHPFAIALFIMETISCGIIFVISIIDMKLIISLICMLITAFMYFICFISDIYGIKIKNNYKERSRPRWQSGKTMSSLPVMGTPKF